MIPMLAGLVTCLTLSFTLKIGGPDKLHSRWGSAEWPGWVRAQKAPPSKAGTSRGAGAPAQDCRDEQQGMSSAKRFLRPCCQDAH